MVLDLRFEGKLGIEFSKRMNQVANEIRTPFHLLVEELSKGNETNLDWWVSSTPSRNTYSSPFFHYCCCVHLLQKLVAEKREIDSIIVDSPACKKVIVQIFTDQKNPPEIHISKTSFLKEYCLWLKRAFLTPLTFFYSHWLAKATKGEQKSVPLDAILIDQFVQDYSIDNEVYYPGLLEFLSEEEKRKIFFIPTLYKIPRSKLGSTFNALRASEKNYLLKEDFLKWEDYFYAWGYVLRSRCLRIPTAYFSGINIKPLVVEEIRSLAEIGPAMIALLNYRFSHRLEEKKITLKMVINWFENQIVDKGWNAGFRKHFPKIEQIGYMGFLFPKHCLSIYPTQLEKISKVIPKKIQVIGKGLIETVKELAPDLEVTAAPAFRYRYIWNPLEKKLPSDNFSILVAFPLLIDKTIEILNRILEMYSALDDKNVQLFLKMHPTCSKQEILKNIAVPLPDNFHFVEGDLGQWLGKSRILISAGSGVLMEAIAWQVPVIIIGSTNGLTHHPVPEDIDPSLWRICYTPNELAESVAFYQSKDQNDLTREIESASEVRENYFKRVEEKSVREFLQLA